ncbi:MAG: YheU family protein [Sandaracinaceae bacterium]|nr:YheU family protein [Sandaracinaceae bacterium]
MSGERRIDREDGEVPEGEEPSGGVVVPWDRLSPEAQRGVLEDFVTREGTEYGLEDVDLETKIAQVRRQVEDGEVVVVFDPRSESVGLVRAVDLRS